MAKKNSKAVVVPSIAELEEWTLNAGSDDISTFGGRYEGGIHLQQVPDEIAACFYNLLCSGVQINSYLEIGVAAGGFTHAVSKWFAPETIVLVDDNKHHKAHLRTEILKGIACDELIGHSHEAHIIKAAQAHAPYDMIMLDGDHSYAGIKLDALTYIPMLAVGGHVMFHDSIYSAEIMRVVIETEESSTLQLIGHFGTEKYARRLGLSVLKRVA